MGPEHLAQGASGDLTCEAVDVDFLIFMLLAHRVAAFLQGPTEEEKNHKSGMSPLPVPSYLQAQEATTSRKLMISNLFPNPQTPLLELA